MDTIRVAVLGDSLAYGKGDESDGGIAGRLKRELASSKIRVEVQNYGVNGATTAEVKARLKQARLRSALGSMDAVVLSAGANDLFRDRGRRDEMLRAPFAVAERILARLEELVDEIRSIAPHAHIFLFGAYNPVPSHPLAFMIERFLDLWDNMVATRFRDDERVTVVQLSDIIDGPNRLSRIDGFHPGGRAYEEAAKRIASMLAAAPAVPEPTPR